MRRLLVKADDYGFTEAISLGILKAFRCGLVRSTAVMVNMPDAASSVRWLVQQPGLCVGLHVNVVIGRPCADLSEVGGMIDDHGQFHSSAYCRTALGAGQDPIPDLRQARCEVEAQIRRFIHLTGHRPEYLEGHAIRSPHLLQAMAELAVEYDLPHLSYLDDGSYRIREIPHRSAPVYDFYPRSIRPQEYFTHDLGGILNYDLSLVTMHPGYLDDAIYRMSSFTRVRTQDLEALTHPDTLKWVEDHQIQLISFRDLTEFRR